MVTTLTADMLEQRRGEALARLARQYPHFVAERDDLTSGHVVRNTRIPGRVELVIGGQCSCRYGKVFGLCRHVAAVEATRQAMDWHIIEGGQK